MDQKIRFSFKTNAFANGFLRRSILKRFVSREEKWNASDN